MIKHVSFDFWDTLYKGNPNFRKDRAKYISDTYGCSEEDISIAIKITKELCDNTSEKTMCTVDPITQAWHLLNQLGCPSIKGAIELELFTQKSFIDNPPIPLFSVNDLNDLKEIGLSISISCNTGLISGNSILAVLQKSNLLDVFDYTLFSDHITYFKPSPFFMQEVVNHPNCKATTVEQILHVGDNKNTDGYMCDLTGANYLYVKKGCNLDFVEIHKLI